ncbi:OmpA family protein [Flavobacterium sp. RSB2_4_14]|uniref:OmpA family protein n=1 Tax=Flavobacterium sp. RSB2_4_14 TaxID=3447665 RepID=UPI003F3C71F2
MKHLNKLLVAMLMLAGFSSQAQDSNNPWAISFGVNAVDTRVSAASKLEDQFSEFFNANDNWNIVPAVSFVNVSRYVGDNFSFGVTGSFNRINRYVLPRVNNADYTVVNPGDLNYYAVDAVINYSLMNLIKSKTIDPSVHIGGGYGWIGDDISAGTLNGGLGLTYWFNEFVGLSYRATYKQSFEDVREDMPSHMQHFAGLTFKFGGSDKDNDGIYDKDDACPEVAGLKQFNGCPDTDGDGIEDSKDTCPEVAGPVEFNGCPDTDGDGISDNVDACVDVKGLKEFNGCPDTDGDGTQDKDDKCPTVAGPKDNAGCPRPLDADKDGVPDLEDDCPTVAGPASNRGCPEVTPEVVEQLKIQARSVFFNSGKSTFKTGDAATITSLDAMREILKNYPNAKFSIEGHTDSDGSDKFNQKLSEDRANAVRNAMIEKGVNPENLTAVGFGESKPIATNKTKEGKAQNRRTEVRHVGSKYEGKL